MGIFGSSKPKKLSSADIRRIEEESRMEVARLIALEREQMRIAKEQEKQRQDIVRHEEWLKKHDEEIEKLQFRLDQAESDIEFLKEKIGNLYALRDMAVNELDQAVIGGKNQTKYQKQIMSLDNQIHAAESKLNKAQFEKRTMERKMEVA